MALPLFEIALVFVRFDHVASLIVNANHSIMWAAAKLSTTKIRKLKWRTIHTRSFKAELQANIRQTITWQRANGILAMSKENLMQVTPTPKQRVGSVGTNARWIYRQMFDDAIAALPRAYRAFVEC
jgi:hypothetical protein